MTDSTLTSTFMIPKKLKTDWVKALRSEDYKQGTKRLYNKRSNSFCCLGVLAHLCGATTKAMNLKLMPSNCDVNIELEPVQYGIIEHTLGKRPVYESLARLNDKGKSFLEIADLIEKYVETY